MASRQRFDIGKILDLPVELTLGELLDRSDATIKELAYNMQRATPRYRVRKASTKAADQDVGVASSSTALVASALVPPKVTAQAYEDDGQSRPVMITAWVHAAKMSRTLLDGGSVVELISERKINSIKPRPYVHTDGHLRVSLATDKVDVLTNYVLIPINVKGVEAMVKARIVKVDIYDLLLGLSWLRRVHFVLHNGLGQVTIAGDDLQTRYIPAQLVAMETGLPTVEFDEDDEESADRACQDLLDDQKNVLP